MTAGRREDLEKEAGSRVSVYVRGVSKAGTRNLVMCLGAFFSKGTALSGSLGSHELQWLELSGC